MKKLLLFVSAFVLVFLSGCKNIQSSEIDDYIPVIELVGEAEVYIELNEEYVDPGARITGDIDIDITTVNNINNKVYGVYSIDYSVIYKGVTISKSRTVTVIRKTEKDFNIELAILESDSRFLVFTVDLNDPNSKLVDARGTLYLEDKEIETIRLYNGVNVLKFTDLKNETTYKLKVSGSFLEDNTSILLSTYEMLVKTSNKEELTGPSLELVGSSEVTLAVGETYTEEGVNVIGDYDIVVNTYSNLDTTSPGTYVVLYSALYNEKTIYITRTVNVIILDIIEKIDFSVSMDLLEASETSLTISFNIKDTDSIIKSPLASLYLGDTLIDSKPYISGASVITFSGLSKDTTYTFALEGYYLENSLKMSIGSYSQEFSTLKKDKLELTLIGDSVIEVEQYKTFVDPGAQVVGDTEASIKRVMDFTTNEIGTYTVTYSTTIDGNLETVTRTVKVVPAKTLDFDVSLSLDSKTFSTLTFNLNVGLNYDKLSVHYASLYKGTELIDEVIFNSGENTLLFENLDENTEYTLKLVGLYTVDSTLTSFGEYSLSATTEEDGDYIDPYVENLEVNPVFINNHLQINVYFDLRDPDNVLYGSLYAAITDENSKGTKSCSVGHNEFVFTNYFIGENEEIEFFIMANYKDTLVVSLNDQKLVSYELTTPVNIVALSFSPVSTYFVGENIKLALELYNPLGIEIDSIMVSGVNYDTFLFPSNNEMLYIDMGLKSNAEDITYLLSGILVTLVDGTSFEVDTLKSVNVSVLVKGEYVPSDAYLKILEITPTNKDNFTVNYVDGVDTSVRLSIYLDNKYDLPLSTIKINGVEYFPSQLEINGNLVRVTCALKAGYDSFKVNSYKYIRNEETIVGDTLGLIACSIYQYLNKDEIEISTVEQFLSMTFTEPKEYILLNDLDFSDVVVNPLGTYDNKFMGCFNGNGYTLSNIYMERTVENEVNSTYFGLFGYSDAFIYNVNISNINIVVNSDGLSDLHVGTVAGMSYGDIYNVSITGDSSVTINGIVSGYIGGVVGGLDGNMRDVFADTEIFVDAKSIDDGQEDTSGVVNIGGVCGYTNLNIETTRSSGTIDVINTLESGYKIGGLVGVCDSHTGSINMYISNSYSTVVINAETNFYSSTGGLIGESYSVVLNSFATGDITVSAGRVGGLIGYSVNKVYGSFALGNITSSYSSPGNVLGKDSNIYTYNTFKYSEQELYSYGSLAINGSDTYMYTMIYASDTEFNSSNFYIEFLLWNSYYFDFSNLDIENGILPILK